MKPVRFSRGHAEMLLAACTFAIGSGLLIKSVSCETSAILIYFVNAFVGLIATAASCLTPSRRGFMALPEESVDRKLLFSGGVYLALGGCLMIASIQMTLVAKAVIVRSLMPVVLMFVAARAMLGEKPSALDKTAAGLGFIGLAIIVAPQTSDVEIDAGVGIAFISMLFSVLNMVNKRRLAGRRVQPETQALYQNLCSVLLVLPFAMFALWRSHAISGRDWCLMVFNGAFTRGLGHVLWYRGNQDPAVTTADAGIITFIEPLGAALLASVVLGEAWTSSLVVGGLCIIVSCLIPILRPMRNQHG